MAFTKSEQNSSLLYSVTQKLNNLPELYSVLIILLVAFMSNLTLLSDNYYPLHDTLTVFQFFAYFYNEFLSSHEIPLWLAYSAYGIPSDSYLMFSFGPFQYLALFIGYLFKADNTLQMFGFSLICDSIFLTFSSYLFLSHILKNKVAVIISVCFIALLAQHDIQLYWNFKILLPIPLVMYCAQRWTETLNPNYLLGSLAVLLAFAFGSLPYVIPFQFYVAACYCLVLLLQDIKIKNINKENIIDLYALAKLQVSNKLNQIISIPLITTIILCILTLAKIKKTIKGDMAYTSSAGRYPNLKVTLSSYLHHGGFSGWDKILEMLNGMPYCIHQLLPFTGIICISLAFFGIISKNKSKSHIALIVTTIFVITFTVVSTKVALIVYFLPKMNLFRHIAYVITIGKIFLVMLAGFGINAYFNKKQYK